MQAQIRAGAGLTVKWPQYNRKKTFHETNAPDQVYHLFILEQAIVCQAKFGDAELPCAIRNVHPIKLISVNQFICLIHTNWLT